MRIAHVFSFGLTFSDYPAILSLLIRLVLLYELRYLTIHFQCKLEHFFPVLPKVCQVSLRLFWFSILLESVPPFCGLLLVFSWDNYNRIKHKTYIFRCNTFLVMYHLILDHFNKFLNPWNRILELFERSKSLKTIKLPIWNHFLQWGPFKRQHKLKLFLLPNFLF